LNQYIIFECESPINAPKHKRKEYGFDETGGQNIFLSIHKKINTYEKVSFCTQNPNYPLAHRKRQWGRETERFHS